MRIFVDKVESFGTYLLHFNIYFIVLFKGKQGLKYFNTP